MIRSSAEVAKEFSAALKKQSKIDRKSKRSARAALIRAGILEKNGKRLAKPYR